KLPKRFVLSLNFEEQIRFNCFNLRITQMPFVTDIVNQITNGAVVRLQPFVFLLLYDIMKHYFFLFLIFCSAAFSTLSANFSSCRSKATLSLSHATKSSSLSSL